MPSATHHLNIAVGSGRKAISAGGRTIAYRADLMNAVTEYRTLSAYSSKSYAIFTLLPPEAKAGNYLFFSFLGNITKAAAMFVSSYTLSETALSVTGTRSSTATTITDGGDSLSFGNISTTIIGDNGKHSLDGTTQNICVYRTPWLIPANTVGVALAVTLSSADGIVVPVTNYGHTVAMDSASTIYNVSAGTKKTLTFTPDQQMSGSMLCGDSNTISKWQFNYTA